MEAIDNACRLSLDQGEGVKENPPQQAKVRKPRANGPKPRSKKK